MIRKLLLIVLSGLMIFFTYTAIAHGIEIGNLEVLSIEGIREKNDELDSVISRATTLTSSEYPTAKSTLDSSLKKLLTEKENYADLVNFSTEEEIEAATREESIETEFLWVKTGYYATKYGVIPTLNVVSASSGAEGKYDINFIVTGQYLAISDYIYALENDSEVAFKIENFTLTPISAEENNLQATWTVKDLKININEMLEQNNIQLDDDENLGTLRNSSRNNNVSSQEGVLPE